MHIAIGSDHRGVQVKSKLIVALENLRHVVEDCGTQGEDSVDYPDFAKEVCRRVAERRADRGILICGTGIGMSITANKFAGVRAASCYDEVMAEMSRRHNDVNVLCLPGDLIGNRPVVDLVRVWLDTAFEGGRHERRLQKIAEIESQSRKNGEQST